MKDGPKLQESFAAYISIQLRSSCANVFPGHSFPNSGPFVRMDVVGVVKMVQVRKIRASVLECDTPREPWLFPKRV